jgi:hypothetical protein
MSVVVVLVGQCGNQVGAELLRTIAAEAEVASPASAQQPPRGSSGQRGGAASPQLAVPRRLGPFFATDGFARCVLVDAEPKVVLATCDKHPTLLRKTNSVTGHSGRGNCWAAGYVGLSGGNGTQFDPYNVDSPPTRRGKTPTKTKPAFNSRPAFIVGERDQREDDTLLLARALRAVHTEVARCEDGAVEAIIVIHSLAGGTGSGFGSALLENLRWYFCADGGGVADRSSSDRPAFLRSDDDDEDARDGNGDNNAPPRTRRPPRRRPTADGHPEKPVSIVPEDLWAAGAYGTRHLAELLVSVSVAPRGHGETTVQSFNAALTLRSMLPVVDAAIILRNDVPGVEPEAWTQSGVNAYFAAALTAVFQGGTTYGAVGELIAKCCPVPTHNVLTILPLSSMGRLARAGASSVDPNDKAAPLAPWLYGFHQSAVTATLYVNRMQPPPSSLQLVDFLHPSMQASIDVVTSVVVIPLVGGGSHSQPTSPVDAAPASAPPRSSSGAPAIRGRGRVATSAAGANATTASSGAPSAAVVARSGGGGARARLQSVPSVLVLNQAAELCRTTVFPLMRDAYMKVAALAFLHNYHGLAGVARRLFPAIRGFAVDSDVELTGHALRHAVAEVAAIMAKYPGVD